VERICYKCFFQVIVRETLAALFTRILRRVKANQALALIPKYVLWWRDPGEEAEDEGGLPLQSFALLACPSK